MALETEVVLFQVERCIELFGEIGDQTPKYVGTMRCMTGNAIILLDRPVSERVLLHKECDIFQDSSITPSYFFIMAGEAYIIHRF